MTIAELPLVDLNQLDDVEEVFESLDLPIEKTPDGTAGGADAPPTYFRSLAELNANPELLKEPECVIPRLAWRARQTTIAGPDKAGKSTLLRHGIARLNKGESFLGARSTSRFSRGVWVGLEEAVGDCARWFNEAGAVPDAVDILTHPTTDLLARINELLIAKPADVVVIDSLSEYARVTIGTVPGDGDNAGWASVVRPLVALARTRDVAIVVLHHVRKSDGTYRGPTEIAAAADVLLELVVPDKKEIDQTSRKISGRGRWRIDPFTVRLTEDGYQLADGGELPIEARILAHLQANGGSSLSSMRQAVGGRASTVDAAIGTLINRDAIIRDAQKRLWLSSSQITLEGT